MAATLNDTQVAAGESVRIALNVENVGERDGTFRADLFVDSETADSKSVAVEAGGSETVVFVYRFEEPGEYEVAVEDASLGTVTVVAAGDNGTTPRPGDDAGDTGPVEVTDAQVSSDWIREGHEATVRATVVNTANRTANRTLTVTVDDRPVANETVRLGPDEREEVTVEFDAVGGTVEVEGVDAGRISVGERYGGTETDPDDASGGDWPVLEFGIAAFVGVVLTLTAVAALSPER
ncbi:CARDB domain-containing protein [Halobaculum sp. EA56]|uniref:CARDB domain-containing protein n=1 Tax=Halobaculum sp. EA56 TaxID=3421648 RepID=UPI003EBC23A0